MYYFNCDHCKSMQKGWMLSVLTSYVANTITTHYKCSTCATKTLVVVNLPKEQQNPVPNSYQATLL